MAFLRLERLSDIAQEAEDADWWEKKTTSVQNWLRVNPLCLGMDDNGSNLIKGAAAVFASTRDLTVHLQARFCAVISSRPFGGRRGAI